MSLFGYGGVPQYYRRFVASWELSFWKLPRSVSSSTIDTGAANLVQVRDIMAQLPNLDELLLSGASREGRNNLPRIGTVPNERFGGRLKLRVEYTGEDIINRLLEIPSRLHLAELVIYCGKSRLPIWAVRLAEACGKTLVKLSHTVELHCKFYSFPKSGCF